MTVIETLKLSKKFGDFTALDSLDLRVEEGEIFGLIGPNGSGKTTTIKILCGLLKPTSGTAKIFGQGIPCKAIMQQVGYMPQETAIYMDNTISENLMLFGKVNGMRREHIKKKEIELLEFVDLLDWKDAIVSSLSGGMRHRVSLACALIHEPRLLFLDEPTVGVDPELRAAFWEYFGTMSKKGITVIITTHYMDEASRCYKVCLLRQGRLVAVGAPGELKEKTGTDSLEDAFLALSRREGA